MTDQNTQQEERSAQNEKPAIIPAEMFIAVSFEAPIAGMTTVENWEFSQAYFKAASDAKNSGDETKSTAYALFGHLTGIMLRATDRGEPWGREWDLLDGRRSLLPSEIKEQIAELVALLPLTNNLCLKARLADMIWTNDKSQVSAATTAVDSYAATVDQMLKGQLHGYGGKSDHHDALRFLQRGMVISGTAFRKGALPESIAKAAKELYEVTRKDNSYVACAAAAELCCKHKLLDEASVASELEAMVVAAPDDTLGDAVRKSSDFAIYLYGKLKDEKGKERCQLHSVRLILAMSGQCTQAGAKASWVMDAIQALGRMRGYQAVIDEMKSVLRELQEASTKEYATFSVPLGIEEQREQNYELFLTFDLSDALKNFALLEKPPARDALRQQALDLVSSSPLMAMMSMSHLDGDGKVIAKTEGLTHGENPSEEWFDTNINRNEGLRHQMVVGACIDPARLAINQKFSIIEEYLEPMTSASWIIPQSQKPLLTLGFTRLLQGDFMSAAHLIVPQLEPCLRYILQINKVDTAKRRNDSTEEDQDLGYLFRNHREHFDRILGPDLTYEIELLFDRKTGDRLRHLIAHGSISAAACYSADVIYACWLIYRLCCLPVLQAGWDNVVRPVLP